MSTYDYSGVDPAAGRAHGGAGVLLFILGISVALVASGVVLYHVLVVLSYSLVLGLGE